MRCQVACSVICLLWLWRLPSESPVLCAQPSSSIKELASLSFSAADFHRYLKEFTRAAHPAGSQRQREISEWLSQQLKRQGVFLKRWSWSQRVPQVRHPQGLVKSKADIFYRHHPLWNVMAKVKGGQNCAFLVGSHYDTKELYSRGVGVGANDSGSSSAALLLLGAFLQQRSRKQLCDVYLVWFDGEESVLWNWWDGGRYGDAPDHLYGSRHLAARLVSSPAGWRLPQDLDAEASPLRAVLILDMIGSAGMKLTADGNSSGFLRARLWRAAQRLRLSHRLQQTHLRAIQDDHLPFLRRGIPALLLIDFTHLDFWHTPHDLPRYVDFSSVQDALKLALAVVYDGSSRSFDVHRNATQNSSPQQTNPWLMP